VFTEQGTAWVPEQLATLDSFARRMSASVGSQEAAWGKELMAKLSLLPSEYWARQCHVGASFIRPAEVDIRHRVGVERIMWGSDFPHREGCWPFSTEHLRLSFAGVPSDEVAAMVGANAARVYGFDLDALGAVAARIGPAVDEVARPLDSSDIPTEALRCPTFAMAAADPATAPARP
jgi:hypothetical protein